MLLCAIKLCGRLRKPCYTFNNNKPEQAFKCAQEAQKLNGSKRAKHCARSIALLASTGFKPLGAAYSAYIVGELQWLMDCSDENSKKVSYSSEGEYYSEVMEYIMYNYLIPRYNTKTTTNERLALMAFMDHPHKPEYYKDNEETGRIPCMGGIWHGARFAQLLSK